MWPWGLTPSRPTTLPKSTMKGSWPVRTAEVADDSLSRSMNDLVAVGFLPWALTVIVGLASGSYLCGRMLAWHCLYRSTVFLPLTFAAVGSFFSTCTWPWYFLGW